MRLLKNYNKHTIHFTTVSPVSSKVNRTYGYVEKGNTAYITFISNG